MADSVDAIISIHPNYADAILAGTKTIELRRRIPELRLGTRLWIYATRPVGAVIGFVTIQSVSKAHPSTIWKRHRNGVGIDYDEFKAYFSGTEEAIAIALVSAKHTCPITVDQLREIRGKFHPPQVLTRLTESEGKALRRLAAA